MIRNFLNIRDVVSQTPTAQQEPMNIYLAKKILPNGTTFSGSIERIELRTAPTDIEFSR